MDYVAAASDVARCEECGLLYLPALARSMFPAAFCSPLCDGCFLLDPLLLRDETEGGETTEADATH